MDRHFSKRWQKTLYCGELEPGHVPLALSDLCVEYFQCLVPFKLDHVDLESASTLTSQESVSPSSMAMSMIYAKRLQRRRPDHLKKMSSSDLFFLSMMMASKYLYDEGVDEEVFNDEWAETAGMEKDEVNSMEREFLDAMDWELFIKKDEFDQAVLSVERSIAFREGIKRGWFSYTDLCLLWEDPKFKLLAQDVGLEWIKVVAVSIVAYVAAALTMVGSTVLVTNASLVLASSGMLPVLLHSVYTPISLQPSVNIEEHPHFTLSPSNHPALLNETATNPEESSGSAEVERTSIAILNTIMSQLMAVLTLKSHLLQFVQAVSDNFTTDRLHFSGKNLSCPASAHAPQVIQGHLPETKRNCNPSSPCRCWSQVEKTSPFFDPEWSVLCPHCDMDRSRCTYRRDLPLQNLFHDSGRKTSQKQEKSLNECQVHGASQCHESLLCGCALGSRNTLSRRLEQGTSMPQLFLDITIGFATSMPPLVFAT